MSSHFLDASLLDELSARARSVPRLRAHHNLHDSPEAQAHRMLVAMEPGSYVRPHRHLDPNKAETIVVLRGRLGVLVFDDEGRLQAAREMTPGGAVIGYNIPPGVFHSIVCLAAGTIFIEAKAGPYAVPLAAEWGAWSPAEGEPGTAEALAAMRSAFSGLGAGRAAAGPGWPRPARGG